MNQPHLEWNVGGNQPKNGRTIARPDQLGVVDSDLTNWFTMEGDASTGPAVDWGPRTPGHCPVCGTIVPKVEDPNYGVRVWARHLNYQKHLKEVHPAFYAWNHRWDTVKILPFIPTLMLAIVAAWQKDTSLLLLSGVLSLVVLALLLNYRRTRVRRFRESWRDEQALPATT